MATLAVVCTAVFFAVLTGTVVNVALPVIGEDLRLVRDYKRLPETLAGLHLLAFTVLMLKRFMTLMAEYA